MYILLNLLLSGGSIVPLVLIVWNQVGGGGRCNVLSEACGISAFNLAVPVNEVNSGMRAFPTPHSVGGCTQDAMTSYPSLRPREHPRVLIPFTFLRAGEWGTELVVAREGCIAPLAVLSFQSYSGRATFKYYSACSVGCDSALFYLKRAEFLFCLFFTQLRAEYISSRCSWFSGSRACRHPGWTY